MIYTLFLWTVVGVGVGDRVPNIIKYDWRPMGEFHSEGGHVGSGYKTAKQMCEDAASQLGLKLENYRCVKSK